MMTTSEQVISVRVDDYRGGDVAPTDVLHVRWHYEGVVGFFDQRIGGLLGVLLDDADRLSVKILAGNHPPARILIPLLDTCYPEWQARAQELHARRVNPHAIHVRTGMSGCETYMLRTLLDRDWMDAPICSALHLTMLGKFGGFDRIWLGDLLALLAAASESRFMSGGGDVDLQINTPFVSRNELEWRHPGYREEFVAEDAAAVESLREWVSTPGT